MGATVKARALVATAVHQVEVRDVELPRPGDGEVLVEALYTCISPGTELRCLAGQQRGTTFPFIPGYAMVGRVARAGAGVDVAEGTVAFLMGSDHGGGVSLSWGGHMSHAVCSAGKLLPIPDGVDLVQAAASKMASIPYHGLRLCQPLPEERIAIIGLGAVGHMAAKLYALAGAHTAACDVAERRIEQARGAGIEAMRAGDSLKETFARAFPEGADAVVDCTGVPSVFAKAIEVCRDVPWGNHQLRGPRYIVQGSYPDTFSVPYGPSFMREVSIHFPRSEQDRDRVIVFDLLRRGTLSLHSVISDVCKPSAARKVYDALRDPNTNLMTVVFDWTSS
jgi:2-desacetyl-2-hydroxyethyl bacteriochlorophyllide A dehydrogenase